MFELDIATKAPCWHRTERVPVIPRIGERVMFGSKSLVVLSVVHQFYRERFGKVIVELESPGELTFNEDYAAKEEGWAEA